MKTMMFSDYYWRDLSGYRITEHAKEGIMEKNMRMIGMKMCILMGFTMSVILSLVGTATSGHFTVPSWLISFGISLVISLVIGFVVPVNKLGDMACRKCKAEPRSLKGNLISSLVSNLIYTPIITILMVTVMVGNAAKHAPKGAVPPVTKILPGSLLISLVVGYVVIVIAQPLYLKLLLKNVPMGERGKNRDQAPEK